MPDDQRVLAKNALCALGASLEKTNIAAFEGYPFIPLTRELITVRSLPKFATSVALAVAFHSLIHTTPASAHAPVVPIPLSHVVRAANALKAFAPHGRLLHSGITTLPGAGSRTVRLNNSILKSLATSGYSNGQNDALSRQVSGAISSGSLSGSLYYNQLGAYQNLGEPYNFAIGSNPYNNGNNTGFTSSGPTGNMLNFSATALLRQHNVGSVLPYSGGVSGAERARTNLYKNVVTGSTAAGEKSFASYGPITGGEFYGTVFFVPGANFIPIQTGAYAFGSNPYSSSLTSILPISQLRNYISFANGTRIVSGGQLSYSLFGVVSPTQFFKVGVPFGLAFGNSPFNAHNQIPYALFKNEIYFAAVK